jgi:hypothetical protein
VYTWYLHSISSTLHRVLQVTKMHVEHWRLGLHDQYRAKSGARAGRPA